MKNFINEEGKEIYKVEEFECTTEESPDSPYYGMYLDCDSKLDLEGEELFDLNVYE